MKKFAPIKYALMASLLTQSMAFAGKGLDDLDSNHGSTNGPRAQSPTPSEVPTVVEESDAEQDGAFDVTLQAVHALHVDSALFDQAPSSPFHGPNPHADHEDDEEPAASGVTVNGPEAASDDEELAASGVTCNDEEGVSDYTKHRKPVKRRGGQESGNAKRAKVEETTPRYPLRSRGLHNKSKHGESDSDASTVAAPQQRVQPSKPRQIAVSTERAKASVKAASAPAQAASAVPTGKLSMKSLQGQLSQLQEEIQFLQAELGRLRAVSSTPARTIKSYENRIARLEAQLNRSEARLPASHHSGNEALFPEEHDTQPAAADDSAEIALLQGQFTRALAEEEQERLQREADLKRQQEEQARLQREADLRRQQEEQERLQREAEEEEKRQQEEQARQAAQSSLSSFLAGVAATLFVWKMPKGGK